MTQQQYENWKDFALRMARVAYKESRRPSPQWIENVVSDFFDNYLDDDLIEYIIDWDETEQDDDLPNTISSIYLRRRYVCDLVIELLDDWRGSLYIGEHGEFRDRVEKAIYQWEDQWGRPVRACLCAGLDLASSPSAGGVIGFNAGDIRAIYPEGVPEWVKNSWHDREGKPANFDEMESNVSLRL